MEEYLQKSTLASLLNALGVYALLMLCGLGWFIWLWGMGVPSLLAGAALGLLLVLAAGSLRRHAADDRAESIRRRLGAELALEELLLLPAEQAHLRTVRWLADRYALIILQHDVDGVLCRYADETLLIRCIARPERCDAGCADAAALARDCRLHHADRGVLCLACRADKRLAAYAEACPVPLRIIDRAALLTLAGLASPATDEQLMALKMRRERRSPMTGLVHILLHPGKARRYMGYGLGLMLMYILTGLRFYPIPGALCMGLSVLCRCRRMQPDGL